uniref:Integrase catalytic domain-containing protein n=1 Tax=Fagus sylvatica TaxID=28930 RepID=A0A2N9HH57_FAGSY
MEGAPNDGTSADPAMTPIERQMQVIATSIQDLARETSRQNQELWQAIRKGPPTPHDNNQPPPRGGNRSNDQEADSHQVTRRRGDEVERTPPRSRHRAESAGSSAPPSQHKTAKTTRSSKQPERPDRSSKQPEREDRRGNSSRQPDHPDRSTRDPDDKTARLEKELREMRKQMGDMKNSLRAKAARNLDNLVHRADSPFIPSIADFPLPSRFKVPLLENFDGTKDPFDYLEAFKTIMQLQAVPEEVMCRAFPLGLRGSARVWFNKLESESIGSFVQLSRAFIDHFIGSQRRGRPPTHLLSVKQMEGESLRTFVHRFNEEAMKIDRPKEDVTVTAFMAGRPRGYGRPTTEKAEGSLRIANLNLPSKKFRNSPKPRNVKRTTAPPVKFSSFTPLNTPIDKLLLQIQDDPSLRWPGKIRSDPNSRPKNLYCRFHRDHGHLTEECVALKEQIETLIRQGKLQKYVNRPTNTRPAKPPAQREQAEPNRPGPVGEIRTIVGGPASGGTSRASRKAYARQVHNIMVVQRPPKNIRLDDQIISFSEEDARGTHQPHDDALVITINIAGFTTRRVMVDNGSSADILYLPAYQQMRLDKDKLRPMDAPLVGFTGDKICPVGIVTLPINGRYSPKDGGQNQTMSIEEQKVLVKPSGELDTIELEDGRPERTTKIGADLPPENEKNHSSKRNNAIMEEVDKLLAANFIREVFYPDWLANVVMVKKSTGKWRMCVDFTDLNKACPKDSFPLPRIDQLVDSTAGHKLLTFMDAFSGYNQIVMDESDQEKTSFITSRGLFCYKVMPFGLKNAGATYQRLMNRMFHDQIGRNVEVYVDDMLGKVQGGRRSPGRPQRDFPNAPQVPDEAEPNGRLSSASSTSTTDHEQRSRLKPWQTFIAEFTSKDDEPTEDVEQASKWTYPTTNNEAEYEALLMGLKTAKILGATELDVRSDSQLVVGQVNGDYEAKEGRMQQYLQLVPTSNKASSMKEHYTREASPSLTSDAWHQTRLTYVMREIHEGVCGDHSGARALQRKIVRAGYYWPSMKADTYQFVQHCDKCQRFANLLHSPPMELVPMTAPWPFAQFGIPRVLVSDNGKQFDNPRFRQFSQELGIHNHYSSPGHPQANGQVEVTNRSLLKLIKTRLEGAKGLWPEELPSILWAYRTTVRIPTGETPFRMTFGSEAVSEKQQKQELKRYQEKMARHYNSRVKPRQLSVGDLVLRKVTLATKNPSEGKLGPNWEGPYKVIEIRRPGTYHLEDMNGRRLPHPWNAEHLRKYYP